MKSVDAERVICCVASATLDWSRSVALAH